MTQRNLALRVTMMIAGPALVGLTSLLSGHGSGAAALSLPALWVGVLFVMLPTLYIGAAILQVAPTASELGRAAVAALERSSVVFLGLVPALAFLVATSVEGITASLLTKGVVALGAILGLGAFYRLVFGEAEHRARVVALFAVWALVCLAIGAHLFSAAQG